MRYVVLTDQPARMRAVHRASAEWRQMEFATAAEALAWERAEQACGATALESRGFRYGCVFCEDRCSCSWVERSPAA